MPSGMINQPMNQQAAPPPTMPAQPQTPPVTPQAQGQLKPSQSSPQDDIQKYVTKATILIHSKETTKKIQAALILPDPVQQIANLTVMIIQRIDSAARQQGVETQDNVKLAAAKAIIGLLCELAQAMKKFTLSQDLKTLALATAMQDYYKGEIKAGRIDPIKLKQSKGRAIQSMPPQLLQQSKDIAAKLPMIAKRYNHGKGLMPTKGV